MDSQRNFASLQVLARRLATPIRLDILIVDPDRAGARMLAQTLRREHAVAVVGTAEAALCAIEARVPTILVTALVLPDGSGVRLIETLRSGPTTRHVLLVALAERASVSDKIAIFAAGADDCLVKPIEPRAFADHLRRLSSFRQVLGTSDPR
jgi:DNA-binding response OmpR family regulator